MRATRWARRRALWRGPGGPGRSRDEAYALVQSAAARAWDEGASFREMLESDPEVRRRLGAGTLDSLFNPQRSLVNLGGVFDKLEKLPVESAPESAMESEG